VSNISNIGLKKPVTVAMRVGRDGETKCEMACGEGRLEAFKALGQTEVPALLVDASREELLLMSLVENLARRQRSSLELCREILAMKNRGQKIAEIATKVDLDQTYVRGVIRLLERGEERLLIAVERHKIPLSMAIAIAQSDDREIEQAMAEAYERGELKGKALLRAKSLVARRRGGGKGWNDRPYRSERMSANTLLSAYRKETARQQFLMSRAKESENRLRFLVSAMKRLLADEGFVTVLRAESMASLPKFLADLVGGKENENVA
jgi:ParB family chromosome partitioning protein